MNKTIAAILFLWAGLSLGVASIATPAKFLAPSLPMVQVLDVGRWTFPVLALIEWGLVVAVAVLVAIAWRSGTPCIGLVARLLAVVAPCSRPNRSYSALCWSRVFCASSPERACRRARCTTST
jgi:hypothetical protein